MNKDTDSVTLETRANEIYEWEYDVKDKGIIKYTDKKRTLPE